MLSTSFQAVNGRRARFRAALACALLGTLAWAALAQAAETKSTATKKTAREAHLATLQEDRFPSAGSCRTCHPDHYREWSASPHAYAQMSVVFQSMHAAVVTLTNGTNGDFCIRCHTPVGMNLGEKPVMSNEDRHPTSREGITCISCHRVAENYQRISGRFPIKEAPLCEPVYGPSGNADGTNEEVARVLADPNIRVAGCDDAGRTIHETSEQRVFLTESGFCGACHDVRLVNGFRLEDAFSEYKTSPAALAGVSCQDCHMSKTPGVNGGYNEGPAAIVGGIPTNPRKLTNHMFAGPDYSVIHPALFPVNPKTARLATISEWVDFDYEGGWGSDAFEEKAAEEEVEFPSVWRSVGKRRRARALVDKNCDVLDSVEEVRLGVLQAGFRLGDVKVEEAGDGGISFAVQVFNGTDGHGVPTGFDAERIIFLQVTVRDKNGKQVFVSGDRDPNGDLRDLHSLYVHNGETPRDPYLFSLQSKFLTRNLRGTEREQVLPINFSPDPLPFLRPEARPTSLYGRPRGARKHKQVLLPGADRWPEYEVSGSKLRELGAEGPYTAEVELIAQMIPVNLIAEISFMGFEYGMSPRQIADNVVAGAQVLWRREVTLQSGQTITEEADRGQPAGALQCRNVDRRASN